MNPAILTSLIAVCGVLVGAFVTFWLNKSARREQMEFDAEQKRLDRLSKLRTDVYIDAAEQMVRVNIFIATLANLPFSEMNQRKEFADFAAAVAKLGVVAESETVYLVNELQALVSKAFMRAGTAAWPVNVAADGIKRASERHSEAFSRSQSVFALMTEAFRNGNPAKLDLNALKREHDEYLRRMEEASEERQKFDDLHQAALARHRAEILPLLKGIREALITCMSRVRSDLGLTTSTGKLKDQMERMGKEAEGELANLMSTLQELRKA